jgi:hypothetical protein
VHQNYHARHNTNMSDFSHTYYYYYPNHGYIQLHDERPRRSSDLHGAPLIRTDTPHRELTKMCSKSDTSSSYLLTNEEAQRLASLRTKAIMRIQRLHEEGLVSRKDFALKATKKEEAIIQGNLRLFDEERKGWSRVEVRSRESIWGEKAEET